MHALYNAGYSHNFLLDRYVYSFEFPLHRTGDIVRVPYNISNTGLIASPTIYIFLNFRR